MSDTKTVLITGSNRGIGLVFVQHYATNGWKVFAAARDVESATDLKNLKVPKIIALDVTDENSIIKTAEELRDEPIDLLINNAGVSSSNTGLVNVTKTDLLKLFEVNAVGPFFVTKAFLPNLKLAAAKHGSATVAQISSQRGSTAQNDTGGKYGYRTSKVAFNMMNTSLASDLKDDKIVTLALHPGYVVTRMTDHKGEVTPEESVAGLSKIIANVELKDSGRYLDFLSNTLPW